jgi:hypothetical protein
MKPLFLVLANTPGTRRSWRVCTVNLEGEPVSTESTHFQLREALNVAGELNKQYGGLKPALSETTKCNARQGGR